MRKGLKRTLIFLIILLLIGGGYIYWALSRSLPLIVPTVSTVSPLVTESKISWPALGQSAVGVLGTSIIDTHETQKPVPTASTAKMITALMVLKVKPLSLGDKGPLISLTPADVAIYNAYVAEQGSVVQVQAGEQMSEYQMLEAMLLPSANNIADSIASWAYGSLPAYSEAANQYLQKIGLSQTHVGPDASGFIPSTVSTAHDLVRIGEIVMNNPVLASIVKQTSATGIPVVNNIKNVNYLLGTANIIGVKTGNTDQAGGVYVGAAKTIINGQAVTIVTADEGTPNLAQAVSGSLPLIVSAQSNYQQVKLLSAGSVVANYILPWDHQKIPVITSAPFKVYVWGGDKAIVSSISLKSIKYPALANQNVGSINSQSNNELGVNSASLKLQIGFSKPSILWRLEHP